MSRVPLRAFSLAAAGAALALSAYGQAVISTRSGVVHFFEGAVSVAGRPLEAHFGKFTSIPEGAELRTEQGRAEVLLTPGVILRVGEKERDSSGGQRSCGYAGGGARGVGAGGVGGIGHGHIRHSGL